MTCLLTPAMRAISSTRAPARPSFANSSRAADRTRARVRSESRGPFPARPFDDLRLTSLAGVAFAAPVLVDGGAPPILHLSPRFGPVRAENRGNDAGKLQ